MLSVGFEVVGWTQGSTQGLPGVMPPMIRRMDQAAPADKTPVARVSSATHALRPAERLDRVRHYVLMMRDLRESNGIARASASQHAR